MLDIKNLDLRKIKLLSLSLAMQIAAFGVGLYCGERFLAKSEPVQLNYTTNQVSTPEPMAVTFEPETDCPIKGNISGQNKIYHMTGGAFYDRTTAEVCFSTEGEAIAEGFTKSSR